MTNFQHSDTKHIVTVSFIRFKIPLKNDHLKNQLLLVIHSFFREFCKKLEGFIAPKKGFDFSIRLIF